MPLWRGVREHADICNLIHGHEWGGVLAGLVTLSHFRQLQPGARAVIVPHGGHMWSLQWKPARGLSVEPLRIDHQACFLLSSAAQTYASPEHILPLQCRHFIPAHPSLRLLPLLAELHANNVASLSKVLCHRQGAMPH